MVEAKTAWKAIVARALAAYMAEKGSPAEPPSPESVVLERPPKPELGDFGFPMFPYAKLLRAGAHVFVCGDGKRMAPAVREAIQAIAETCLGAPDGALYLRELEENGRYAADVFSG